MTTLAEAVTSYAKVLHHGQDEHHVGSALGAWVLLATAGAGTKGADARKRTEELLGMSIKDANYHVERLLQDTHPAVKAAVALWVDKARTHEAELSDWLRDLPGGVSATDVPTQAQADQWTRDNTNNMVESFPLDIDADTLLILANALVTDVTWEEPFARAESTELGAHTWGGITGALRSRESHDVHLAQVEHETYGVHVGRSDDGLVVVSVIGEEDQTSSEVLEAAHEIGIDYVLRGGHQNRVDLRTVPTEGTYWHTTTRTETRMGGNGYVQDGEALLVSWESETRRDLGDPVLGISQVAGDVLGHMFNTLDPVDVEAVQVAKASYHKEGFRAAAVSALGFRAGAAFQSVETEVRTLHLRYNRPYAVVAFTTQSYDYSARTVRGKEWHGVPVFGAWVTKAVETT